jgi:hypothetical protein
VFGIEIEACARCGNQGRLNVLSAVDIFRDLSQWRVTKQQHSTVVLTVKSLHSRKSSSIGSHLQGSKTIEWE